MNMGKCTVPNIDFYKIQNPYRNCCDVTGVIYAWDQDKFKKVGEKFQAITWGKNNLRDVDTNIFFIK